MGGPVSLPLGYFWCPVAELQLHGGGKRFEQNKCIPQTQKLNESFCLVQIRTEVTLAGAVWLVPANREVVSSGNDLPMVPVCCCRPRCSDVPPSSLNQQQLLVGTGYPRSEGAGVGAQSICKVAWRLWCDQLSLVLLVDGSYMSVRSFHHLVWGGRERP